MSYAVDFNTVSTVGLESSPVAAALAGLRENDARCFKNKYRQMMDYADALAGRAAEERSVYRPPATKAASNASTKFHTSGLAAVNSSEYCA